MTKTTPKKKPTLAGPIVPQVQVTKGPELTIPAGMIVNMELDLAILEKWDKNPRNIKAADLEKLQKSLKKNPTFIQKRPLLVNYTEGRYIVYAGNMRLAAARIMGMTKIWCTVEASIPQARMREEALKDNIEYGQWDMDILADEFSEDELKGMDLPDRENSLFELNEDDLDDDDQPKKENKNPYQQMTFTVAAEQAELIQTCIAKVMKTEQFKYMPTYWNQNMQGNALFMMVQEWSEAEL